MYIKKKSQNYVYFAKSQLQLNNAEFNYCNDVHITLPVLLSEQNFLVYS